MSDNDLDLPLLPSAEQIRRKEFASVRRGYDAEQVRSYLGLVADQVEKMERELNDLRSAPESTDTDESTDTAESVGGATIGADAAGRAGPLPALQPSRAPSTSESSERISSRIAHVLEAAEEQAKAAIEDARAEAADLLAEARGEADRIRVDAQARAEEDRQRGRQTLAQARQEAAEAIVDLRRRRDELSSRLREMRSMLLAAAEELRDEGEDGEAGKGETQDRLARPSEVEVDSRIEQIFGPRGRVDLPDLESTRPEPEEGT